MKHKEKKNNVANDNFEEAPVITADFVEMPNSNEDMSADSNSYKHVDSDHHKKHHDKNVYASQNENINYWDDNNAFTSTNTKLFKSGRILTAVAGSFFAFAVIMFFVPATNIVIKNSTKPSFSFNNIYALLVYYSIALILSFAAGIVLSKAEFKINKHKKIKRKQLRPIEQKELKQFAGLTFVNRSVFVLSLSIIIVIALFMWILSWVHIPVKLLEGIGVL